MDSREEQQRNEEKDKKVIYVRCSPLEHAQIETAAMVANMSINEFCKIHLLAVSSRINGESNALQG